MTDNFEILNKKVEHISTSFDVLTDITNGKLPKKDILTANEVSKYSGLSISTIYHETSKGLITYSKKGKKLFFPILPFIEWYIDSYLQNSIRRKLMDSAIKARSYQVTSDTIYNINKKTRKP